MNWLDRLCTKMILWSLLCVGSAAAASVTDYFAFFVMFASTVFAFGVGHFGSVWYRLEQLNERIDCARCDSRVHPSTLCGDRAVSCYGCGDVKIRYTN